MARRRSSLSRTRESADLAQGLHGIASHACELGHGRVDARRAGRERQVALPYEVAHALSHLVVEDAVVFPCVAGGVGVIGGEEHLLPDLGRGDGRVDHGELDAAFSSEVIEQLAPAAEHGLLVPLACRLVADIVERDGLAEQPVLNLADAILVHEVEADRAVDVLCGVALPSLFRGLVGKLLLLVFHPPFDRPAAGPGLLGFLLVAVTRLLEWVHDVPPPSSWISSLPFGLSWGHLTSSATEPMCGAVE